MPTKNKDIGSWDMSLKIKEKWTKRSMNVTHDGHFEGQNELYTTFISIQVSVIKIRGAAHKSGDVDCMCKRALIFTCSYVWVDVWYLRRGDQRSRFTADYHCSNIINRNPVQTNSNKPLQCKHHRVITVKQCKKIIYVLCDFRICPYTIVVTQVKSIV